MKSKAFKEWLSHVHELDEDQVDQLFLRLKSQKRTIPNVTVPVDEMVSETDDWIFAGIVNALKNKGKLSKASMPMLFKSKGYKAYNSVSSTIQEVFQKVIPKDRSSRETLGYMIGLALIRYTEGKLWMKQVVSASDVLLQGRYAREAFEMAFPGYYQSNLIHFIVRQHSDRDGRKAADRAFKVRRER